MARGAGGVWRRVDGAATTGEGLEAGLARLRSAAGGVEAPVMLWLPESQILRVRVRGGDRRAAKAALALRLGAEVDPAELVWDTGRTFGDGATAVAATWRDTVAEAESHARRWGFSPLGVTARPTAEFPDGPRFSKRSPLVSPAVRRARQAAPSSAGRPTAAAVGAVRRAGLAAVAAAAALTAAAGVSAFVLRDASPREEPAELARVEATLAPSIFPQPGPAREEPAPPTPPSTTEDAPRRAAAQAAPGAAPAETPPDAGPPAPTLAAAPVLAGLVASPRHLGAPVPRVAAFDEARPILRAPAPPVVASLDAATPTAPSPPSPPIEEVALARSPAPAPPPRPALPPVMQEARAAAPAPPARPARLVRPAAAPARPAPSLPASIAGAATRRGAIDLDKTALLGVMAGRGAGDRQALVRLSSGAFRTVRRGDVVDGWTVSQIEGETVVLRNGSRRETLRLPR